MNMKKEDTAELAPPKFLNDNEKGKYILGYPRQHVILVAVVCGTICIIVILVCVVLLPPIKPNTSNSTNSTAVAGGGGQQIGETPEDPFESEKEKSTWPVTTSTTTSTTTMKPTSSGNDCSDGYTYDSITKKCEDVDECAVEGACNYPLTFCLNTPGAYMCSCPPGQTYGSTGCESICLPGLEYNIDNGKCEGSGVDTNYAVKDDASHIEAAPDAVDDVLDKVGGIMMYSLVGCVSGVLVLLLLALVVFNVGRKRKNVEENTNQGLGEKAKD